MRYNQLGRSGLKVSELCLGTMTFGHGADQAAAQAMVDEALVATKFYNPMGSGPNDSGMSRHHIMNAIEASLRRLQMDHVDIYYIHHVDQQTPIDEMLRALDDLVHAGKVRYIACSNYEAWRLMEALWISESNGLSRFVCYQPQYNLVVRDIERDLIPACTHKGLGVVPWGPLAGGFLSGKYAPGERSRPGTRSQEKWAFPEGFFSPQADDILRVLIEVAAELGRGPAETAIRWILEQPAVSSVIVGARTIEQFRSNASASGWAMPAAALARLNEVSAPRIAYPESMEWGRDAQRLSAIDRT